MGEEKRTSSNVNVVLAVVATVLACIVAFIALGIWYNNNHYTDTYETNFINACTGNGGTRDGCYCALDYVKDNYSFSEAKKMEETGSAPDGLAEGVQNACS